MLIPVKWGYLVSVSVVLEQSSGKERRVLHKQFALHTVQKSFLDVKHSHLTSAIVPACALG